VNAFQIFVSITFTFMLNLGGNFVFMKNIQQYFFFFFTDSMRARHLAIRVVAAI